VRFGGNYSGSSFQELLEVEHPRLRPDWAGARADAAAGLPHGTTVLALRYADGVLVAGDRLATEGHRVASRDIQKVYPTDGYSLIAIAGAAGPSIEMARMLRIELEHYEKIEGEALELEGKANKLSQMVRANLPAAMQGLVVVPIFAGYDRRRRLGRLWKYDLTGGRYEEADFEASGSGGVYARESLKKSWRPGMDRDEALRAALQALADAADEDRATGGVDLQRRIFPVVKICHGSGVEGLADDVIERVHREHVRVGRARAEAEAR
jgi:proteasome beta subunit